MKKRHLLILIMAIVLALVLSASVIALTEQEINRVIVNSADWRDVYSSIMYANLQAKPSNFLVSTRHSTLLLNQLDKGQNILLVSSKKNPYAVGYASLLEAKNFQVENIELPSANLALAKRLDQVTNYLIIDDAYGYNAIAVAPYAAVKKSFVIFADKTNIGEVESFLSQRSSAGKLNELIVYGNVDREVKTAISRFNPTTINKGDRFENNIEIVKKYQQIVNQKQAILSNGEFIEASIMSGTEPVLFIGSANVPDPISAYIKSSDIKVGILIGNELIGTATTIRRQIGIPVFVKFAQSARAPQGSISPVDDLDRFPMPKYNLGMSIQSVRYNSATKQIEVTYKNNVNLGTYIKSTITLNYGNGQTQRVGDTDAVFVEKNGFLTVTYDVEQMDGTINADVFAVYGEGKKSLEYVLRASLTVQSVKIFDESDILIESVLYDKTKKAFIVKITNKGNVDAYVGAEIFDLVLNDELKAVGSEKAIFVPKGGTAEIIVPVDLSDQDIANNAKIHVRIRYGERENALVKSVVADFSLEFVKADITFYVLLIVILILLFLLLKRRKKKEEQHGHHRF